MENMKMRHRSSSETETGEIEQIKYEKPQIRTLHLRDILMAVKKGAKFPARGFAG